MYIKKLENILSKTFMDLGYDINVRVSVSNIEGVDFQCDDAFKLAKVYKKAPMIIGEEVVNELNNLSDFSHFFKTVILANPGFINIVVSDKFICDNLREIMADDKFGIDLDNKKIVLDYGGPNVAKPLHVGHLRTAIIGQAINNILKFQGNETISDVHLGDIGMQMGQVIYGILHDFPSVKACDVEFDLNYLNVTYPKISALCKEDESVKEECAEITKKLQEGDAEYKILWEKIYKISVDNIKKLYKFLNVSFDYWYGESDAYKYFKEMIKHMEDKGVLKLEQGARVIEVAQDDDKINVPPCIVQKSNGAYLYSTSDLGTIWQREHDFHPDEIIYVADARQSLHFLQVFRAAKLSEIYCGNLSFIGYGTVNGTDNKPFKTRSGDAFKLEDLFKETRETFISLREENKDMSDDDLDKIVNAIIKFADLQNDLERNYIFDINKFSSVNGKTGPYVLYTYLRINKLLDGITGEMSDTIYNEADRNLRLKLLEVTNILNLAIKERRPHYIVNYLYDLSVLANNFYGENRVNGIEGQIKIDYENVLTFNNKVLKTLLELLEIYIPKVM